MGAPLTSAVENVRQNIKKHCWNNFDRHWNNRAFCPDIAGDSPYPCRAAADGHKNGAGKELV